MKTDLETNKFFCSLRAIRKGIRIGADIIFFTHIKTGKIFFYQYRDSLVHIRCNICRNSNLRRIDPVIKLVSWNKDLNAITLSVNYGRRIDRPYYQDLNPFISPLDKSTYYTGNPFLKPSLSDNIEIDYTYHDKFTAGFEYSRSRDDVNETIEIVDRIYYSRPGNIGNYTVITFSLDGTIEPVKWFSFQFHTHAAQIHSVSDFYTGRLDTKGTHAFVRPVFTFNPGKDWVFQLDGAYQSRLTNAQFIIESRKRINAAVSKKLSSAASVKMVVNDMFYMFGTHGTINNLANTTANWTNWFDSRTFVLSFSYRFGKSISDQRKHDANGAENEQNRVKN